MAGEKKGQRGDALGQAGHPNDKNSGLCLEKSTVHPAADQERSILNETGACRMENSRADGSV